jgi:hypothetical protein
MLHRRLTFLAAIKPVTSLCAAVSRPSNWRRPSTGTSAPKKPTSCCARGGNPPGNETLGMLVPARVRVLAPEGWGVIISFSEDAGRRSFDRLWHKKAGGVRARLPLRDHTCGTA